MPYRRCGTSGLVLPAISLGLWANFGGECDLENAKRMVFAAFDRGVTYFDLANHYGPPPGSAERTLGRILKGMPRDQVIIATKAGVDSMARSGQKPGPYGEWGSKKSLISSLDRSLRNAGVEYFDIFYHHRQDPRTPIDESMAAIEQIVRQGKALYAGVSNYTAERTELAAQSIRALSDGRVPLIVHQTLYNLFDRRIENDLLPAVARLGIGMACYSPLAGGQLTDRYLQGVPGDSRACSRVYSGKGMTQRVTSGAYRSKIEALSSLAAARGQTMAQMALAWILRDPRVTTVVIGASRVEQIEQNLKAAENTAFTREELEKINALCPADGLEISQQRSQRG